MRSYALVASKKIIVSSEPPTVSEVDLRISTSHFASAACCQSQPSVMASEVVTAKFSQIAVYSNIVVCLFVCLLFC